MNDWQDEEPDELNDDILSETSMNENKENLFTIINTNARSLTPKMASFIENFKELEANLAVITETWLTDGQSLQTDIDDLLHGTCLLYTSPSPRD